MPGSQGSFLDRSLAACSAAIRHVGKDRLGALEIMTRQCIWDVEMQDEHGIQGAHMKPPAVLTGTTVVGHTAE